MNGEKSPTHPPPPGSLIAYIYCLCDEGKSRIIFPSTGRLADTPERRGLASPSEWKTASGKARRTYHQLWTDLWISGKAGGIGDSCGEMGTTIYPFEVIPCYLLYRDNISFTQSWCACKKLRCVQIWIVLSFKKKIWRRHIQRYRISIL